MEPNTKRIEDQVKLPPSVAFGVVWQGIRIRFGRNVITISGVALGIAFLMSIFAGKIIQDGVAQEEEMRNQIGLMHGFLTAQTGPVADRTFGAVQIGPLNDTEKRFIRDLGERGAAEIRWASIGKAQPGDLDAPLQRVDLEKVAVGASAVLLLGESAETLDRPWAKLLTEARQPVLAAARTSTHRKLLSALGDATEHIKLASLQPKLTAAQQEKARAEKRRDSFRNIWIITISLLVTIIGISNAMLMSVTERFRESGTMKCLGAMSAFIRQIFLIESSLIGTVGALAGALFGTVFATLAYGLTYGFAMVFGAMDLPQILLYFLLSVVVGIVLSIVAALYPAHFASKMVPATALRSNI